VTWYAMTQKFHQMAPSDAPRGQGAKTKGGTDCEHYGGRYRRAAYLSREETWTGARFPWSKKLPFASPLRAGGEGFGEGENVEEGGFERNHENLKSSDLLLFLGLSFFSSPGTP